MTLDSWNLEMVREVVAVVTVQVVVVQNKSDLNHLRIITQGVFF